jgi:hypothetical protein
MDGKNLPVGKSLKFVAERGLGAIFERIDGATGGSGRGAVRSVRTAAQFGTLLSARNQAGHDMWHDEAGRGRAGQAF